MLELKGIKKDYLAGENTVHALKGIDLKFRQSEFVSILGQSGRGRPHHQRTLDQRFQRPRLGRLPKSFHRLCFSEL